MLVHFSWGVVHRTCSVVDRWSNPKGWAELSMEVDLPVKDPMDLRREKARLKAHEVVLQALLAAPPYLCKRCHQEFRDVDPGHTATFLVLSDWLESDEESAVALMGHQGRPGYWGSHLRVG